MLDIKRVLKSAKSHKREGLVALTTPWTVSLEHGPVLPEHPRPTMVRDAYTMLNGHWDYAIRPLPAEHAHGGARSTKRALDLVAHATAPECYDGRILVPFSPEAPASGVGRTLGPDELLWYRTTITVPRLADGERLIVHFEAVDWTCAVRVGGEVVATHVGGYLPFDVDMTAQARARTTGCLELSVCVFDPSDTGPQLRGKQRLDAGGIWYTPQSGIWQSVWYEVVPAARLAALTLNGTADGTLRIAATIDDPARTLAEADALELTVRDADGRVAAAHTLPLGTAALEAGRFQARSSVKRPRLWSPEHPHLYDVEAALRPRHGTPDTVRSYCAFRTVEVRRGDAGAARFLLNGEPLFIKGVLDQGYWPDGLMTAPSDEALIHDIAAMRDAGFNMLRKHIKIERARWYYHCDRLGMLAWQDAVSGGGAYSPWHTSRKPTLIKSSWGRFADDTPGSRAALSANNADYQREWIDTCTSMVEMLAGHPSIVCWVLFNEGWGQFDARKATERVRALDPTRTIDATSGWYDQGCGDFLSHHNYFRPLTVDRDRARLAGYAAERGYRAFVLSEFGGWTQGIPGHMSSPYAYGYGNFPALDAWRDAVRATLAEAAALEARGAAGYVYTQVSDVEEELNGILTYDRRVNKLQDRSEG